MPWKGVHRFVWAFSLAFLVTFSNYDAKHLVVKRLNIMTSHYNLCLQGVIKKFSDFCSGAKDISVLLG